MLILEQRKRRSGPKPPLVINHQHPLAQGLINASPYWHPRAEGFSSNMLAPRKRLDVSGGATPQFVSAGESGGYNVLSTNNAIYNAVPADKRKILDASGVSFAALSYVHADADVADTFWDVIGMGPSLSANQIHMRFNGFADYWLIRYLYNWNPELQVTGDAWATRPAFVVVAGKARYEGGSVYLGVSVDGASWDTGNVATTAFSIDQAWCVGTNNGAGIFTQWLLAWDHQISDTYLNLLQDPWLPYELFKTKPAELRFWRGFEAGAEVGGLASRRATARGIMRGVGRGVG